MPDRILIADDNPVVRTALRHLLESIDSWEIIDAENGQQALAKAQELQPDLIILDLVMPVMDGLTAAREISKLLPETPLVMHTLHWSPQLEVEAQKVGVRKLIPKTDSKALVSAVQQSLASTPPAAGQGPEIVPGKIAPAEMVPPEIVAANIPPPNVNVSALPAVTEAGNSTASDKRDDVAAVEPGEAA